MRGGSGILTLLEPVRGWRDLGGMILRGGNKRGAYEESEMPIVQIAEQAAGAWRPGQVVREVVGEAQGSKSVSMQHFTVEPEAVTPLHRHDVDEAILVLGGKLRVRIKDQWSVAETGDVCVFPANTPHGFVGAGDGISEIMVVFPIPAAITAEHTTYLEGGPPVTWEGTEG